jgi:tol-pal system protein YbgF
MTQSFQELRESILDMNSRMQKMDAKMNDLRQAVDVNSGQRPPPPTSGNTGGTGLPTGGGTTLNTLGSAPTPPPGMQAETTYTNAYRDYSSGNLDLALQEFLDYLKYFQSTQLAPNAQYYLGDIYYRKGDYLNAVQAFDGVLEHYSETNKTADAHYMKGVSLLKLNRRDAAAKEFKDVINRYPASDLATKSKQKLRELGLSAGSTPAPRARKRR